MRRAVCVRPHVSLAIVGLTAMVLSLVPASPASAGQVVGFVHGIVELSAGVGACGTGSLYGTVTGVDGTRAMVSERADAQFNYCSPDLVTGVAVGSLTISGHTCSFSWQRLGLLAVANVGTPCHTPGTAVASFVPVSTGNRYELAGVGILPI